MRKLLVHFVMIVMVFSLCACGEKEDVYDEERVEKIKENVGLEEVSKENVESESIVELEDFEAQESNIESGSVANEKIEECTQYPLLYTHFESQYVTDDFWYFYAKDDNVKKLYIYDIKKKGIVNREGYDGYISYYNSYSNICDLRILDYENGEIKDIVTGEVIVRLTENQYFVNGWYDDSVFVYEVIETFEGNTYYFGVMDVNGKWIVPLSADYPWISSDLSIDDVFVNLYSCQYAGDGIFAFNEYLFDSKNNYVVKALPEYYCLLGAYEGVVSYVDEENEGIYTYDIVNGEYTELFNASFSGNGFLRKKDNSVEFIDMKGNIIVTYDMSSYQQWDIETWTENRILFICDNGSGTKYVCILNADGTLESEPWKLEELVYDIYCKEAYINNNQVIIIGYDYCSIYDINSKEMVTKETPYRIISYLRDGNMLLVEADHSKYGEGCYLVDINDLDTLINPFEMKSETTEQKIEKVGKLSDLDLIKQIIGNYTNGEVFSHAVINQMPEGIEAFALTEEVFSEDDEEYTDIIQANENYGDDIHRMSGWYINGMTAKRVFMSSDEGKGEGYIPTWLNQEEIGVGLCPLLKDGTQLIQVDWSISGHNNGSVFYELVENDVTYAFSGNDMMYITDDGSIMVFDYYYDSLTETEISNYWEYIYENKKLNLINSWTEEYNINE